MKKIIVPALLTALALSGCAVTAPEPTVTVTVTAPAPTETVDTASMRYLDNVRLTARTLDSDIMSDDQLLEIGQDFCTLGSDDRRGLKLVWVLSEKLTRDELESIERAADGILC